MNNIVIINGSPKAKISVSKLLIDFLQTQFSPAAQVFQATQLLDKTLDSEEYRKILQADVLLLVFPLYIDALPAPLVKVLNTLEIIIKNTKPSKLPLLYAVVNCGFFEAQHNLLAIEILENFASRCGLNWMHGLAIGSGGLLLTFEDNSQGSVMKHIYDKLSELAQAINSQEKLPATKFVQPQIPRLIYTISGNISWKAAAKKRNTTTSLKARPHTKT